MKKGAASKPIGEKKRGDTPPRFPACVERGNTRANYDE